VETGSTGIFSVAGAKILRVNSKASGQFSENLRILLHLKTNHFERELNNVLI
jgi:hypothetical protein